MGLVSIQEQNILRNIIIMLNKFNSIKIKLGTPIPPQPTAAAGGGGTSNLANGTYYLKFTAIDASGNETIAGNQVSVTLSGGTTDNQIVVPAGTAVKGAVSYRVYRSTTSGSFSGYYARTAAQFVAGFTDNGAGDFVLVGTSAPPSTNTAFYTSLQDSIIDAITTVENLKTEITNASVAIQEKNEGRKLNALIEQVRYLAAPFPKPSITSLAAVGTGSGFTAGAGTYYYKITAIDEQGRESIASEESSLAITTADSITVTYPNITGATTHRIYRGTSPGGQNVYFTDTVSTFSDTGAAGTPGTPPTGKVSQAGAAIFTDTSIAGISTFAGLLALITAVSPVTLDSSLSSGEQTE